MRPAFPSTRPAPSNPMTIERVSRNTSHPVSAIVAANRTMPVTRVPISAPTGWDGGRNSKLASRTEYSGGRWVIGRTSVGPIFQTKPSPLARFWAPAMYAAESLPSPGPRRVADQIEYAPSPARHASPHRNPIATHRGAFDSSRTPASTSGSLGPPDLGASGKLLGGHQQAQSPHAIFHRADRLFLPARDFQEVGQFGEEHVIPVEPGGREQSLFLTVTPMQSSRAVGLVPLDRTGGSDQFQAVNAGTAEKVEPDQTDLVVPIGEEDGRCRLGLDFELRGRR